MEDSVRDWLILDTFLFSRLKASHCVLMRFVSSYGDHTTSLRAHWSRDFLILTNFVNINSVSNTKLPLSSRVTTFEGSCLDIRKIPLKPDFTQREVNKVCNRIADHVQSLTLNRIGVNHMEMFFRRDKKSRLWLLFCSEFKLIDYSNKEILDSLQFRGPLSPGKKKTNKAKPQTKAIRKYYPTEFELRHTDKYIEPDNFLQVMNISPPGGKFFYSNLAGKIHCSFCFKVKPLDCELTLKQLTSYLIYDEANERLVFQEGEPHAKKFIENLLIEEGFRHLELESPKLVRKDYMADPDKKMESIGRIPQALEWALGPMTASDLIRKLQTDQYQKLKLKCCSECFLKYTSDYSEKQTIANRRKQYNAHIMQQSVGDSTKDKVIRAASEPKHTGEKFKSTKLSLMLNDNYIGKVNRKDETSKGRLPSHVGTNTSIVKLDSLQRETSEKNLIEKASIRTPLANQPSLKVSFNRSQNIRKMAETKPFPSVLSNTETKPEGYAPPRQYYLHRAFILSKEVSRIDHLEKSSPNKNFKTTVNSEERTHSLSKPPSSYKFLEAIATSKYVDRSSCVGTLESSSVELKPSRKYRFKSFSRETSVFHGSQSYSRLLATVEEAKQLTQKYSLLEVSCGAEGSVRHRKAEVRSSSGTSDKDRN